MRALSKRVLVFLTLTALAGGIGYHIAKTPLIGYRLVSKAHKAAHVSVPDASRPAFVEAVKAFGSERHLEMLMVRKPNAKQVAFELSNDVFVLYLDNPFPDSTEYVITFHTKGKAADLPELDGYWEALESRLSSVPGASSWVET